MSNAELFMLRMELDPAGLFDMANRRRLPVREVDEGYLVHCALRGIFGETAPQPFSLRHAGRTLEVLGYGNQDADHLREHARTYADPLLWRVLRESSLMDKRMPATFAPGVRLGFETRICPVVRMSSDGPTHRAGAELDAFLVHSRKAPEGEGSSREEVYRQWLSTQIARDNAAEMTEAKAESFQRRRLVRSRHTEGARFKVAERPDTTFHGTLEVRDSAAFAKLLRRGIGRHRAFGFGMLLLKPSRVRC